MSTLVWNSVFQLLNNPEFGREQPDELVLEVSNMRGIKLLHSFGMRKNDAKRAGQ